MRFPNKSEREINEERLLPEGEYEFKVMEAKDASTNGVEFIKLTLNITDSMGRDRKLFDTLHPSFLFKVKHFCDITGLEDKYQSEELTAQDCLYKKGICKTYIQKSTNSDYPDKASVKDYISKSGVSDKLTANDFKDDELPW